MNIKALSLALLVSVLQTTAYTDVQHISTTPTTNYAPGKVEITLNNLPGNMKTGHFEVHISEDGKEISIEGHSKKTEDVSGNHPAAAKQYRTALATKIALDNCQISADITSQTFTYDDRKKAALKGIILHKYSENTLRITLPISA